MATSKLSLTMQGTLWHLAGVDARSLPYQLRAHWRQDWRTLEALRMRGLVVSAYDGQSSRTWGTYALTDAGRAWIVEQIEAARIDALRGHVRRAQTDHDAAYAAFPGLGKFGADVADLAARALAARWDATMVRCPAEIVERDEAEADRLNAALDSRNALWAREQARTTDAQVAAEYRR